MILVDTSVWVDHLRKNDRDLSILLNNGHVVCHEFIIGELACGNLKNRRQILALLSELPHAIVANHAEVIELIDKRKLMGKGIGWIDAHILASALISGMLLWTKDTALAKIATQLKCNFALD